MTDSCREITSARKKWSNRPVSKSFAEAARRLGMPANTISRHVQQLEGELKSRLILRTTRKLTLTAVGQTFYEQCAQNIEGLVLAGQQAADTHPEPVGPLRVSLAPDFFELFPISWVTDFLARYPGINLESFVDNAYLDLISSGVDLAFRPEFLLDENATRRVLISVRWRLVAAPKYLESRGTPTCPDELNQHDCLLFSRNAAPVTWHLNGPAGRAEVQVHGRFLASTSNQVRQAAIDGLGIALLTDLHVKPDVEDGRLVGVLDQYRSDETRFCAVFPDHRHLRRIATIFVEYIQGSWRPCKTSNSPVAQDRGVRASVYLPANRHFVRSLPTRHFVLAFALPRLLEFSHPHWPSS